MSTIGGNSYVSMSPVEDQWQEVSSEEEKVENFSDDLPPEQRMARCLELVITYLREEKGQLEGDIEYLKRRKDIAEALLKVREKKAEERLNECVKLEEAVKRLHFEKNDLLSQKEMWRKQLKEVREALRHAEASELHAGRIELRRANAEAKLKVLQRTVDSLEIKKIVLNKSVDQLEKEKVALESSIKALQKKQVQLISAATPLKGIQWEHRWDELFVKLEMIAELDKTEIPSDLGHDEERTADEYRNVNVPGSLDS